MLGPNLKPWVIFFCNFLNCSETLDFSLTFSPVFQQAKFACPPRNPTEVWLHGNNLGGLKSFSDQLCIKKSQNFILFSATRRIEYKKKKKREGQGGCGGRCGIRLKEIPLIFQF